MSNSAIDAAFLVVILRDFQDLFALPVEQVHSDEFWKCFCDRLIEHFPDLYSKKAQSLDSSVCVTNWGIHPGIPNSPYQTVSWSSRSVVIKKGQETVFSLDRCWAPTDWSDNALQIVASKYFYSHESSVAQLINRVCFGILFQGICQGYFGSASEALTFYADLVEACLFQRFAFNSPVWFNVGLYECYDVKNSTGYFYDYKTDTVHNNYGKPHGHWQASACFIQSVEDDMASIMNLAVSEASLFRHGSGTGTNLSPLRGSREAVLGGGIASGPLSFMKVYDAVAGVVKSGGRSRRAAKMQILNVDHPDIAEFIACKRLEETKARKLCEAGYTWDEAYKSVAYQNANLSVSVSDEFMKMAMGSIGGFWYTKPYGSRGMAPGNAAPSYNATNLLTSMAESAHFCGDPGIQFSDTINRFNTCKSAAPINASNPCSEFVFLDDSACNLASINLLKFWKSFINRDFDDFRRLVRLVITAQDILVAAAAYPTKKICENSLKYRPLGLGYTNFAATLMRLGIPYNSLGGRTFCEKITEVMTFAAYKQSVELAARLGCYPGYSVEDHLPVAKSFRGDIDSWADVYLDMTRTGIRNAQLTLLAPTGTISFMMDCVTTGIEPEFSLLKTKQLSDGTFMTLVNPLVEEVLKAKGIDKEESDKILKYISEYGTVVGCPSAHELESTFACANDIKDGKPLISWKDHIDMMAAAQKFLSGAISKTINMPNSATVQDVFAAYCYAWQSGLKCVAIYRDGSKGFQPLIKAEKKQDEKAPDTTSSETAVEEKCGKRSMPTTRNSITHKFKVSNHVGYLTVGLYDTGEVGEIFITMSKEGSTIGGLMDCFGTAISMGLQYGVPLEDFIKKFSHVCFEPSGMTSNKEIRFVKSVVDYIFRWLEKNFVELEVPISTVTDELPKVVDGSICSGCGSMMRRAGSCFTCPTCGENTGCG